MNTNLNDYKERVKRLRKAVTSVLNIECSQSQAYELLAKEENYPNWDSLSGVINKIEPVPQNTLSVKDQIVQLLIVEQALREGFAFLKLLPILKQQQNPIISNGWSKVEIPINNNWADIFLQTNFFSDDVLTILKISLMSGSISNGIRPAIEFLKLDLN